MNVRISHDINFSAVVVDGTKFFPNSYTVRINMITLTDNSLHQNVAIKRLLVFLREIINNSMFCGTKNPISSKLVRLAKNSNVIAFPEEPYDQIVAMILFSKLQSIVEDKFEIESIIIGSNIAPDLKYTVEEFESFEYDQNKVDLPWWERADPGTSDRKKDIKNTPSWTELNLDFTENTEPKSDVEIVFEIDDNINRPDFVVLDGGPENDENDELDESK